MNDTKTMNLAADNIRILAASMVEKAKSGHPGGAMGGADFINVLYAEFLRYDPENMAYPHRDRLFLDSLLRSRSRKLDLVAQKRQEQAELCCSVRRCDRHWNYDFDLHYLLRHFAGRVELIA